MSSKAADTFNRLRAIRGGVETHYIYDASGNLLAEADAANTITRYYIHGMGLLAALTPADALYCYHYDGTGSTVAITDATEAIVNSYAYTPFGMLLSETEAFAQPFKFVGKLGVMAEPDNLYYMRARYYDAAIGRFLSEDPLGFDGGDVNLYGYAGNNPVMYSDPTGLWTFTLEVNISAALGFGGGGGMGFNIGHSQQDGWSGSVTGIAQGGAYAGAGAGLAIAGTLTNASNVNQLNGTSTQTGRSSIGPAYAEATFGDGYQGITIGGGPRAGWSAGATAGSVTRDTVSAIMQYSNGTFSVGNTGSSSIWSSNGK